MDGMSPRPTVVAVTGATGSIYAARLLRVLPPPRYLIISDSGRQVCEHELGGGASFLESMADRVFRNDDLASQLSSGSGRERRMVVVPCSMNTLSKMACGISDNLITRSAAVCLKQDWKVVVVPRETPLGLINLENMTRLKRAGATVLPACPGFYDGAETMEDLVDFVVGRVLDALGFHDLASELVEPWNGMENADED